MSTLAAGTALKPRPASPCGPSSPRAPGSPRPTGFQVQWACRSSSDSALLTTSASSPAPALPRPLPHPGSWRRSDPHQLRPRPAPFSTHPLFHLLGNHCSQPWRTELANPKSCEIAATDRSGEKPGSPSGAGEARSGAGQAALPTCRPACASGPDTPDRSNVHSFSPLTAIFLSFCYTLWKIFSTIYSICFFFTCFHIFNFQELLLVSFALSSHPLSILTIVCQVFFLLHSLCFLQSVAFSFFLSFLLFVFHVKAVPQMSYNPDYQLMFKDRGLKH